MAQLTVEIPDKLEERLRAATERRNFSVSHMVCRAIELLLDPPWAAEIDIDQLRAAERDPQIRAMLKEAMEEGERVVREGRRHW